MNRVAAFFAATAFLASPALAGTYTAKPVAAPSENKIIGKDISWACAGETCRGTTDASRPLVICQDLAKRAGRLESFAADGRPLSSDELGKCNSAARDGAAPALARAN